MDSFLKMDVFFLVATLSLLLISLPLALVLYRAYRLLIQLEEIATQVKEEALLVRTDINTARTVVRKEYLKVWSTLRTAGAFLLRRRSRKSETSKES